MKKSQLSFGLLLLLSVVVSASSFAQNRKTENLVVITLDGLRWQEVFQGLDKVIVKQEMFTKNAKGLRESFAADATESSRQKIFPFLWSTVAKEGQIYGNRLKGSLVNVKNKYQFSYPGYNELFTGFPDVRINSNDNINNPNENVFEFIQKQPGYENEVAVFATWETMPYILNRDRSGLNINADRDSFPALSPELKLLDDLQKLVTRPVEVRLDSLTYMGAREYMKVKHPKVMYISFGETDEFAHEKE